MRGVLVFCSLVVLALAQDCFNVLDLEKGKIEYNGSVAETKTGRTCQRWDSQEPHAHKKLPANYPNKDLNENYCRDPDNFGYPWCFTTDPDKKRERCNIPDCAVIKSIEDERIPTECYKVKRFEGTSDFEILYGGDVNMTMRGIVCQKWSEQSPNVHDRTPEFFPNKGLGEHNYCRDPDGTGYPWCYTSEAGVRWEACDIPDCDDPNKDNCKDQLSGENYGLGETWYPEPCKMCECFDDKVVDCFPVVCPVLECTMGNFTLPGQCCPICIEPCIDMSTGIVNSLGESWNPDACESCSCVLNVDEVIESNCTSVKSECPVLDEKCEEYYTAGECCPTCSEECRDEESLEYYNYGDKWNPNPCTNCECITMNGQKREMCAEIYCDIPTHCYNVTYADDQCCPFCGDSEYDTCFDLTVNNTIMYDGTVSVTANNNTCQRWTSQTPNIHTRTPELYPDALLGYHNYCRDPDNSGYLWCYVDDPKIRWEKCAVESCREIINPHNWNDDDIELSSAIICKDTIGRVECAQDKRLVIVEAAYGATGEQDCVSSYNASEHFCEAADNTESIKAKCDGKSYCDLSITSDEFGDPCEGKDKYLNMTYYCKPDIACYSVSFGFAQYNGTRSETKNGKQCQRWNSQRPHSHYFTPDLFNQTGVGEHNYCRDPDGEGKPWCYTMDEEKRWEFCGVPECEGYSEAPNIVMASKAHMVIRIMSDAKNIDCQYVKEGEKKVTYIGKTNTTTSGRTCQRWTETSPHFHTKMPDNYPDAGLGDHNFCRDPDGTGKLWCYTADPAKRFEFCTVPTCSDEDIEEMGKCDDVDCGVGGECLISRSGETACMCKKGFIGFNSTCFDINECKRGPSICSADGAKCVNFDGGYKCECSADGFYYDNGECKDASVASDDPDCAVPEFIKTPYQRYDINLQDQVTIDCEADNDDIVYWTKGLDGVEIADSRKRTTSTLKFNKIRKKDIDNYNCVILNECTGLTKTAKVDLHAKMAPCTEPGLQKYGMVWDNKEWDEAYGFCNSYGLKLAVPRSKTENRIFIQDAWRSFHLNPNGKKFKDTNWIWIAANDRLEENEFTDVDGKALVAPKWWPENPDNWKAVDPRGQDEIAFHLFSGYWDDSYGFIRRPFACECNFEDA